jgi:hypothetical protein
MGINKSERIADKLVTYLSDLRIDTRQVGKYFARIAPPKIYDRFDELVESAEMERTELDIQRGEEVNVYKFFKQG